nr:ribonuclease H-like domain, reverse transcriptase, RNA-dependent DNA polymerase [Tanacetum cinerariifolium]
MLKKEFSEFRLGEAEGLHKGYDRMQKILKFGMIVGCDTEDAIEEGASKIYNLITRADKEEASTAGDVGDFALMGITFEIN